MRGRVGSLLSIGVLVVAAHLASATAAMAHYVTITASAACSGDTAVITYSVESFTTSADGTNPLVQIVVNGYVVATGAFQLPTNSFSGTVAAPSGSSATVEAVAAGTWGDGADGGQSDSTTVSIPTSCATTALGRFTGGGSQISIGNVKITKGLTIHCDLLLSNNLEVNWNGHQFHVEDHITTVSCTDNPDVIQQPPAAPLDTLVGIGVGRYDGVDGFTIEFTLVDAGEPGTSDSAALRIYQTSNPANVVLNLPLTHLDGGNLQAHFDQPHKK
jgi:hypothetical protein